MSKGCLFVSFVIVSLVLGSTGCKKKRSEKPLGSCDEPKPTIGSRVCRDFYFKDMKRLCNSTGTVYADKPCDMTGAVGACHEDDEDRWYYTDSGMDQAALSKFCAPKPMILPGGATVAAKTAAGYAADKLKENMGKYSAAAKPRLATIANIAKKLPAPTGKVNLEGLKGDKLIVHAEDLADPEHPKTIAYRLKDSDYVTACARVLAGHQTPRDEGNELFSCGQSPFLAVVSVTSVKKAAATGSTQSGNTKTTLYSKGRITGDVLLFRLDTGKYLGSFGVDASNGEMPVFPNDEKLEIDLYQQFASALTSRAGASAPGMYTTFSFTK